jgi:hypothetical protein
MVAPHMPPAHLICSTCCGTPAIHTQKIAKETLTRTRSHIRQVFCRMAYLQPQLPFCNSWAL